MWTPDGKEIIYQTDQFGDLDIRREPSNNSDIVADSILGQRG